MKIVRIFTSDNFEDGVWSIHLNGDIQNEFDKFFDLVNDIEWLHDFFERNKTDLEAGFFGKFTVGEAVLRTLKEVEEMEDALYDYAEQGFTDNGSNLQQLFKPLNNFEYAITINQKSKARLRKGWLRLYAIRLAKNCYLVTGGAIKLTLKMKNEHLQKELNKLEQARLFLRNSGIDCPEDLNTYQDE